MTGWENCDALERDPEKLGGVWIFRDTRVPVSALFANLRDGATVAEFLEWFPGVEPWQVEGALDVVCRDLESSASSVIPAKAGIQTPLQSNRECRKHRGFPLSRE